MSDTAARAAIQRRLAGWRAAELRELRQRREESPLDPDASLAAAIEAFELLPDTAHAQDHVRLREVEQARKTWAKLRAGFVCRQSKALR
jgi:hypothetical protein